MKNERTLLRNIATTVLAIVLVTIQARARSGDPALRVQFDEATTVGTKNENDLLVKDGVLSPGSVIEVPVESFRNAERMPYWNGATASQRRLEFVKNIRVISVPGYSAEDIRQLNEWRSVENLYISKKQLSEATVLAQGAPEVSTMRLRARTPIRRNDGRQVLPPQAHEQQTAEDTVQTIERMNQAVAGAGTPAQTYGVCSQENYRKILEAGVPRKALQQALARIGQRRDPRIKRTDYMAIADFTKNSNERRLFIINLRNGDVEALFTAHGRGRGSHTNTHLRATYRGSGNRSFLTPEGFHVTSPPEHNPRKGLSLRLDGIDRGNANSASRGILIHGQNRDYATEAFVRANGHTGRSEGCLTVDPAKLRRIVAKLAGGALVYNYFGSP